MIRHPYFDTFGINKPLRQSQKDFRNMVNEVLENYGFSAEEENFSLGGYLRIVSYFGGTGEIEVTLFGDNVPSNRNLSYWNENHKFHRKHEDFSGGIVILRGFSKSLGELIESEMFKLSRISF